MEQKGFSENLLFTVVIGLIAAAINYFRLPLFFEAEFIFGQFLVLLIAVYRGPVMGLLAALTSTITLVIAWGSFWACLTFGLEALFVGWVCRNNRSNLILAVIIYWVLIGMPISWISISNFDEFLESHKVTILIKQLTNAIIYANIAAILILVPWIKQLFRSGKSVRMMSLRNQSAHLISTLLISIGVLFFFYTLNQSIKNASEKFSQAHKIKHQQLNHQVASLIESNLQSIEEFRYVISELWDKPVERNEALSGFHKRHPEFGTMLIANSDADIIDSSPAELMKVTAENGRVIKIADREYFKQAMESDHVYVSQGFAGRGFGDDLIAAVSVSIPSHERGAEQMVLGVVEGSFVLDSMGMIKKTLNNVIHGVDAVLLDQNNQVLLASDVLSLGILSVFKMQERPISFTDEKLFNLVTDTGKATDESYYFNESTFKWGWRLVTLQNESVFAKVIETSLIYFSISIFIVVVISKILAWSISHSWAFYLHRLNNLIERGDAFDVGDAVFEDNDELPEEVKNVYQEIKSSRQRILKMNLDLQNTIAERTEKLRKANEQLNVIARTDELTGLNNRRVFNKSLGELWVEAQRELMPLSMLIIDVDHFKKLNDEYGHPIGDQVLAALGKELSSFMVEGVGCLARIGGEEFCMIFKGLSHEFVKTLAENIRLHVENLSIPVGEDRAVSITLSCGVATINATKYTSSRLYQLADNALYDAKHAGRNNVKDSEEI